MPLMELHLNYVKYLQLRDLFIIIQHNILASAVVFVDAVNSDSLSFSCQQQQHDLSLHAGMSVP